LLQEPKLEPISLPYKILAVFPAVLIITAKAVINRKAISSVSLCQYYGETAIFTVLGNFLEGIMAVE
jgi:hypothetical protein